MIKLDTPLASGSNMGCKLLIPLEFLFWLFVAYMVSSTRGYTSPLDVSAVNNLYISLESPTLPGWVSEGGDPCGDKWQGVTCRDSNITEIRLNGANLGGVLGDKLASFSSILIISLSNNLIGGTIPEGLPVSLHELYLSDNQFTGSIPSTLSELTSLIALSLNNNQLSGSLPDSFQLLPSLTNVDLSSNNFSGKLPPSMASLLSLRTLHIQDNQFSGTLDVLQNLNLIDLNIENNLFSGPVPPNLLNIQNFKKDGNPFNTSSTASSAPPLSPSSSGVPSGAPPAEGSSGPGNSSSGPSDQKSSPPSDKKTKNSTAKIVLIVFGVVLGLIFLLIVVILLIYCLSKLQERSPDEEKIPRREEPLTYDRPRMEIKSNHNSSSPRNEISDDKVMKVQAVANQDVEELEEPVVDSMGVVILPPPPVDKVIVNPIVPPPIETKMPSPENIIPDPPPIPPTSARSFSVASLQQYTNSFSEENLIRDGRLGKVYRANLDDGKQLMVLKLDNAGSRLPVDDFFDLVLNISELHHPNIVELVGFCAEYDQRLLVYNSFSNRTLHDVLHGEDGTRGTLSWKARIQIAFGAAKSLQYLHEDCEPPVVHQNFESANILLDDELAVRVCDCGLASMLSLVSVTQLSGRIRSLLSYEAPEVSESGAYSDRSDVYSFGVVMLELLTGREPYDSSRPRAEQHLVRWVTSQLHDIDNLSKMVDPAIAGKFPVKSLSRFADVISRCIQDTPEFRPQMSEVVQDLARILEELEHERSEPSPP